MKTKIFLQSIKGQIISMQDGVIKGKNSKTTENEMDTTKKEKVINESDRIQENQFKEMFNKQQNKTIPKTKNVIVHNNLKWRPVSEEQRKGRIEMRMKSKKNLER